MNRFTTALGVSQICAWGTLYYSFPQIAEAMGAELGWTKAERYLAPTLTLLIAAVSAIPVGIAIDRGHGRAVMTLGALAAGFLLLAWSRVETLGTFYAVFAGLGIVHAATLYEAAFAVVARHTGPSSARRAITVLTLWGGFASTVFIPLIELMLSHWSWQACVAALGVVPIALCAPLNAYAVRSTRDNAPVLSTATDEAIARAPLRWALGLPTYWALALAFIAHAGVFSAFTYHAYPLLQELGLGAGSVVAVLALIGPAQVAGRLALHLAPAGPSIAALGVGASALTLLVFTTLALAPTSVVLVALLAVAYGAANGVMTIVRGMAVPALLTRHAYGRITASLVAPATVTKAAAPGAAAMLWGLTQGYGPALLALALGSAILALAFCAAALGARARNDGSATAAEPSEV